MAYIDHEDLGEAERILLVMLNLCLVRPEIAWQGKEIAKNIPLPEGNALSMLEQLEAKGYVRSQMDQTGTKRFYLSSTGIIKVSTLFT